MYTYVLRSTHRNVDRIAKPKPHPLKLMFMLLACSVLIAGVRKSGLGNSKNTARSQPETPGTNQEDSLKCWRKCKPGNRLQENLHNIGKPGKKLTNNAHKDSDRPTTLSSHC